MMNNEQKPQLTIPRVIGCLSFFNADNLEIMRGFADNEFDLAIVDPPYGIDYFANLLPNSQGWIFWDKGQRDFSLADGELCWTSFKKSLRVFEMARAKAKASIGYDKIHPTQKPVELYNFCLNFAKLEQNAKILDTHLGSGSIAIAVEKANRMDKMNLQFVGIEIDKEYFEKALNRIEQYCRQGTLSF
jgi:site-specific DNA-methyltransferase (adenine-specific)